MVDLTRHCKVLPDQLSNYMKCPDMTTSTNSIRKRILDSSEAGGGEEGGSASGKGKGMASVEALL